jgi:hypothetical protein
LERIQTAVERKYDSVINDKGSATRSSCRTFIFPGAGGVDPLVEELSLKLDGSLVIDWVEHRGSILTAAYDAEAVGEAIATLLLREQDTNQVNFHFVGISVGAFGANAAATYACRCLGGTNNVRLTLLDPFCSRGVFGPSYGKENFGKYVTNSLQILNTDDPVPTTNDPLPYCYCIDVTEAPERRSFVPLPGDSMHSWPVAYFARHFQELPGTLQKGSIVKVGDS